MIKPRPEHEVQVPARLMLSDQVADFVRQGVQQGRWVGTMPSEAELCRELSVSRVTLRRGMAVLFGDGSLIAGGRGGRHRIGKVPQSSPRSIKNKVVRVLSPQPRFMLSSDTQIIFQTMSEKLGRAGLHLEFDYHPGLWPLRRPDSLLQKLVAAPGTAGWVLYRSTRVIQEWFARSGVSAVILGGVFPDIHLANAEFDLVASCRHAAGVFASRGHQRLIFLSVEKMTAGDEASARSFLAGAAAAGVHAEIAIYDDTVPGLCHTLDSLLLARPMPTGFFVAFPTHAHATIGHLTRRGYPVPDAVAVISRMDGMHLGQSIPSIARYSMDAEGLGRGMARLLRQTIDHPVKSSRSRWVVMPEFIDGETAGGRAVHEKYHGMKLDGPAVLPAVL